MKIMVMVMGVLATGAYAMDIITHINPLFAQETNLHERDKEGFTRCARAVRDGDLTVVKELVENENFDVKQEDQNLLEQFIEKNSVSVKNNRLLVAMLLRAGFRTKSDLSCFGEEVVEEVGKEDGDVDKVIDLEGAQTSSLFSKVAAVVRLKTTVKGESGVFDFPEQEQTSPVDTPQKTKITNTSPTLGKKRIRLMAKNMVGHIQKSWRSWKGKCAVTLTAALGMSLGLYLVRYYRMKKVVEESDDLPLTAEQVHRQVVELLKEHRSDKKSTLHSN